MAGHQRLTDAQRDVLDQRVEQLMADYQAELTSEDGDPEGFIDHVEDMRDEIAGLSGGDAVEAAALTEFLARVHPPEID